MSFQRICFSSAVLVLLALVRSVGLQAQTPAGRAASARFEIPTWAFPVPEPAPPVTIDTVTLLHVPGSRAAFTAAQVRNQFAVPDWHPEMHTSMPNVVAHGRRVAVIACGFCHLPDGAGRPENAMLAGLPAGYIVQQMADIKSRARQSAWHGPYRPSDLMRTIADSATKKEIAEAARYFARQHPRRRARVVEADTIPRPIPALGLYFASIDGGVEPLGRRLIEVASDQSRHEMRDAAVEYIAYVPRGSIARGRALATVATPERPKACVSCHGPQLRGVALVPPLAGRSPSYLLRQLLAFKTKSRSSPLGAPMNDIAATLEIDDMIAAAAYAGSRKP